MVWTPPRAAEAALQRVKCEATAALSAEYQQRIDAQRRLIAEKAGPDLTRLVVLLDARRSLQESARHGNLFARLLDEALPAATESSVPASEPEAAYV